MVVEKQFSAIPEFGKNELEVIFQEITPQNLRQNAPVIYDLFFLFLRMIEPTTRISFDLNLENNEDFQTIDLKLFKRNIIHMFLNTFSVNFYKCLDDSEVINDLKKFLATIGQDFLSLERDYPFREGFGFTEDLILFSQKAVTDKGKENPYYYYAKLLSKTKLSFEDEANFFINVEQTDEPYKYTVEGSIRRVIFNKLIKPLAHPCGFSYDYINRVYNKFEDFFDIEEIQSNFVVNIHQGSKILDFSKGVSYIYYTKDGFGKDNYLITYEDGSYIKKDGSGTITFYKADNTVLSVLYNSELILKYDRKFKTKITEKLTEVGNRFCYSKYWKTYKKCLTISGAQKIGEEGLKICSVSGNCLIISEAQKIGIDGLKICSASTEGPLIKETFSFSEENRFYEYVTPVTKIGQKITIGSKYFEIGGNIVDFDYGGDHSPFAIDEITETMGISLNSDSVPKILKDEISTSSDYRQNEHYLWVIDDGKLIGSSGLKIGLNEEISTSTNHFLSNDVFCSPDLNWSTGDGKLIGSVGLKLRPYDDFSYPASSIFVEINKK